MTKPADLEALLEEVEETLWAEGYLTLHNFAWSMRGLRRGLSEAEVMEVSQSAYDEMRRRHALKLVWVRWPIDDLSAARDADDDTTLDFDIDTEAPVSTPMLALVPVAG